MNLSKDSIKIIEDEVKRTSDIMKNGSDIEVTSQYLHLRGKYSRIIKSIDSSLIDIPGELLAEMVVGLYSDHVLKLQLLVNLSLIKSALEGYIFLPEEINVPESGFHVNIHNENNQSTKVETNITVSAVIDQIQKCENISSEDTKEIIEQIKLIESILSSTLKKQDKWNKLKDIFKYIIDKGIEVTGIVLPLMWKFYE